MTSGLLNKNFVKEFLTVADSYCDGHASEENSDDLGAGILYYSLAYANQARTCVCLGSGGGFVPRLMRQAQRDLNLSGSRTILVDGAHNVSAERQTIWGSPAWFPENSVFRKNYPEIEVVAALTKDAVQRLLVPERIQIDYLHIDADHHYDGVKLDWTLYAPLVHDSGIITLHDTVNYREPCGVPRLLDEIREEGAYEVINFPIAYGTAILRRRGDDLKRRTRKRSRQDRPVAAQPAVSSMNTFRKWEAV